MSSDLIWAIVKSNNSFLVKRNGAQFSAEPNNLLNKNSFKYSGLANKKVLGVTAAAKGKGVSVVTKKKTKATKPGKAFTVAPVARSGVRGIAKTIVALTKKQRYRPDLQKAALARVSAIVSAQKAAAKKA